MSSAARLDLIGKKIAIEDFHNFVETAYPQYETFAAELPDHSMDEAKRHDYIQRVQRVSESAATLIASFQSRIQYITAKQLFDAIAVLAESLAMYYKTNRRKVALIAGLPYLSQLLAHGEAESIAKSIWSKSNIMMATAFAKHLNPHAVCIDGCFYSDTMLQAATDPDFDYLFVDDCMYSGIQIKESVAYTASRGWLGRAYAVVPFVHSVGKFVGILHPHVTEIIIKNSAHLSVITEDELDEAMYNFIRVSGRALTYLQTKMPDEVSVTPWLFHGGNPFIPKNGKLPALH